MDASKGTDMGEVCVIAVLGLGHPVCLCSRHHNRHNRNPRAQDKTGFIKGWCSEERYSGGRARAKWHEMATGNRGDRSYRPMRITLILLSEVSYTPDLARFLTIPFGV